MAKTDIGRTRRHGAMKSADLIIKNGRVFTVNDSQPWAEAVAILGDRVALVGSNEEADGAKGPETKVIDADGRLILPGFIDAHTHCLSAYGVYFWANLTAADTYDDLVRILREHATGHPEHTLVGGTGFRYSAIMVDGRLPGRSFLDKIVSDRPVWLMSYDGWTACTNSMFVDIARKRLRQTFETMPGVERDEKTGDPTGVFYKTDRLESLVEEISTAGTDIVHEGLKLVIDDMVRWGVTSVHDVGAKNLNDVNAYERLRGTGELKVRVYIAMQHDRISGDQQFPEFERARREHSDEWVRVGAVKLFIDGVADSHTAAMLEPYEDLPEVVGETIYTREDFEKLVEGLDRLGFQCITHSCGDRGVRTVLDAYEKAAAKNGPRERRHRIEHVEVASAEDVPRFGALGVIPSMQPLHAHLSTAPFDSVYGVALGPERLERSFPWRGLAESGARLAFSSDWPVADMNPFLGIHTALTRGGLVGLQNTIGLEDAIKGYTINAAYASFEEDVKGSIEVGKLADMVIVSKDLFKIPADEISTAEPLLTIVGGREVHRSADFEG